MKESISYAFLLNVIITFIFICFVVIAGIFSYYRAFRANTAILNAIEKYEGFNCLSQEEISKSLKNIGYNTPFKANQKNGTTGELLTGDDSTYGKLGYSVIEYRNDNDKSLLEKEFEYNGITYKTTGEYQYGVFTYMYMDLPIVNGLLKIPVFGKTNKLYEFRRIVNLSKGGKNTETDIRMFPYSNGTFENLSNFIFKYAAKAGAGTSSEGATKIAIHNNPRLLYKLDVNKDMIINSRDGTLLLSENKPADNKCGIFIDYSIFGGYGGIR